MTEEARSRLRLLLPSGLILLLAWPASAVPPPPARPVSGNPPYATAQTGSKVSTYHCGSDGLVVTETWNFSASLRRDYVVRVNGKKLSNPDAKRIDQEIASAGPFQTNSAYCTGRGFVLALHRYAPTPAQLHLLLRGNSLSHVGLADASTAFKLNYLPVP